MATPDFEMLGTAIGLLAAALLGLYCFFHGFTLLRIARLIRDTPYSRVRAIAMGFCKIEGVVVTLPDRKPLRTPFTKQPCVYYHYSICRHTPRQRSIATLQRKEKRCAFRVQDDTAAVLVDPSGNVFKRASIEAPITFSYDWRAGELPSEAHAMLAQHQIRLDAPSSESWYQFSEFALPIGSRAFVMGTALRNAKIQHAAAQTSVESIVIRKRGFDEPFVVSHEAGGANIRRYNGWALACIIGGPLLAVTCGWIGGALLLDCFR